MKYLSSRRVRGKAFLQLVSLVLMICLAGCNRSGPDKPEKISQEPHASGNDQTAMHGEALENPLRALVQGPVVPGLLGGKGSRRSAVGQTVTFVIANPESGATFAANGSDTLEAQTDTAGIAIAQLTMGHVSTDVAITASVETSAGVKSVNFRAVAGVEMIGKHLEGPTGGTLPEFGIRLQGPSDEPAIGVPVYFSADESSVGATLVLTDEKGIAVTSWKLGNQMGPYFARAEIRDTRTGISEAERFSVRSVTFKAAAVDKRQIAIFLLGGLAIFIYGMKLMSGGLQRMADRRLKAILQAMTRNTGLAVLVGAGLTAMVQSSSATTVLTVGFVNAGLVTLTQAIGVIFGANIGTTITAQMLAFKLTALAYPAIMVGLVLSMFARRPVVKYFGEATLGFGLLFLGMMTMSDILKPLRHSPAFIEWFQLFDCTPIDGFIPWKAALMCVLIGAFVTVIVQSSSASIGLVLALCSQGLIPIYTAFPLILGDNIGTTVTALLASLGANRNAKRAALAHTMFNLFGATYMYILLFVPLWNGEPVFLGFINAITPGEVFASTPENLTRHVANAHTAFNVFNCLIFMPFVGLMAVVCRKIIPMTDEDRESILEYLEPHLLRTPSLALQLATKEVMYMIRRSQKSMNDACDYFCGGPQELEKRILEREDIIDRLQSEITNYMVELSQQSLTPEESRLIPSLIHAVNDTERIGDRSENLIELTHLRRQEKLPITEFAEKDLRELQDMLNKQFHAIYETLDKNDPLPLQVVKNREVEIATYIAKISEGHVARLEAGDCQVQAGVIYLDVISNLQRIGDHLVNIEERSVKMVRVAGG